LPTATPVVVSQTVPVSNASGAKYRITAIGDSVLRGAAAELQKSLPSVQVDSLLSRQAAAAISDLKARRDAGTLGEIVIIHIGTNGFITAKQFDDMMQVLTGVRQVLVLNVRVPRRWVGRNNAVFAAGIQKVPNVVLVDWYAATDKKPDLFFSDGIHLQPAGRRFYADLIVAQLKALNLMTPDASATVTPPAN
jgi:lysophospholipase L1-like esterase